MNDLIKRLEDTAGYIDYIETRCKTLTIMEEGARKLFREAAQALRDSPTDPVDVRHKGQLYTVEYLVQDAKDRDRLDKLERVFESRLNPHLVHMGGTGYVLTADLFPRTIATSLRKLIDAVTL